MKRNSTHIRIYPDVKIRINEIAREASLIEGVDIKAPEVLRRTFNIPTLKKVIISDAQFKKAQRERLQRLGLGKLGRIE